MLHAVILSAGESSRMGRPKALLPIEGKNFVEKIIEALGHAGLKKINVVLGHNAEEMRQRIAHLPVRILINPNYKNGQLSSLQVAVRALADDQDCAGLLMHLVDHPYIDPQLVALLMRRFEESGKLIVVPRFRGKRGHPVIFARELFDEILTAPEDQGAKAVVNAHHDDTLVIETDDEGVTRDIDTPELYRRYVRGE